MEYDAFYLPAGSGQRFCLFHPAQGDITRGLVLYVHPFAEEMNKSRRMAALQSRALAAAGYAVLQIDLLGCGDSSGDFADASWSVWVDDVVLGARWLRQLGTAPLWLWGLRSGCLLIAEAVSRLDGPWHLLLWQPVPAGKPLLQQFLRVKAAADMLTGAKGGMDELRRRLSLGERVEVAGYALSAALAAGLERATLTLPAQRPSGQPACRVECVEISAQDVTASSPMVARLLESWRVAGFEAVGHSVCGPMFWQTTEIEEAPAMIAATLAAVAPAASRHDVPFVTSA